MHLRYWAPLIGLVTAVFLFNMSEFMPIGILTGIAEDLDISESTAGSIISIYAWAVAILSLPMMLLFRKMEYRKLMLLMVAIFASFQALSGLSNDYLMLVVSRLGVAFSHSVFWSIVTPMAVMSVNPGHRRTAIGAIAVGTSMAMILGLPLGRTVGLLLGWRMSFILIAVMAVCVLVLLFIVLPKMENPGTFTLSRLPDVVFDRRLLSIYVFVAIFVTGHFIGYSYIEPFLKDVGGMSEGIVTIALTLFGAAGIVGGIIFARWYDNRRTLFILSAILGACLSMLAIAFVPDLVLPIMVLCFIWGLCITLFNTASQNEVIRCSAMDSVTIAVSLMSGIYNVGIAMGSLLGGMIIDHISIDQVLVYGAVVIAISSFVIIISSLSLSSHKVDN